MTARQTITVFEHESLRTAKNESEKGLTKAQQDALERFYKERDFPYYSLIHNGVKFGSYVGIIQVGSLVIEVLPKADQVSEEEKWRDVLIGMLRASGLLKVSAPSASRLTIKPNHILDLYIELFVSEVEYLLHSGLVKKYRKTQGNVGSIKGRIVFPKHIQLNHIHQERIYSEYTEYSRDHVLHSILYKALRLLPQLNVSALLSGRIQSLLLNFPEVSDIQVHAGMFDRVVLSRSTQRYQSALDIARLLLLNYHPDLTRGSNDVLALMFDMNLLWERFVYASLKRYPPEAGRLPRAQDSMKFWKPYQNGRSATLQPDVWFEIKNMRFVIDTKWKNVQMNRVSPDDLRQMFAYKVYFNAAKVALVYPDPDGTTTEGRYLDPKPLDESQHAFQPGQFGECALLGLPVQASSISEWQKAIAKSVIDWAERKNECDDQI